MRCYQRVSVRLAISTTRIVVLLGCAGAGIVFGQDRKIPSAACPRVPSESFDSSAVDSLFSVLARDATHDLKGVLIRRHRCTVAERYFNGDDSASLHDIRSATKSITSALVGLAIQQHLIRGVEQPLGELLPDGMLSGSQRVRLRDVLTMRSGLDSDDRDSLAAGNENRLDQSTDWAAFVPTVPMKWPPGERYVYSSLNAFLAGAVVEHTSRLSLQTFAERYLFGPLGIRRFRWRRGPRGEGVGQGNLSITARDMAAIGELYLRFGRVDGQPVIDSTWVTESLASQVNIAKVDRYADGYGYMWYSKHYERRGKSIDLHFASGNGGNKIYLVPTYDLVIAITSGAYGRSYGQERSERILLRILDALDDPRR